MNKVITINLGGNAYQLEEGGYDALRAYLETAAARLAGNPDRDEILSDIERAIADKFRALLASHKTVVETKEVTAVLAAMGPVEADSDEAKDTGKKFAGGTKASEEPKASAGGSPPRRLYRIYDGAMISGVCNGIAAYLNTDPTLVRIGFVLLTIFWGMGLLVYIVMAIVIPEASTPEEKSAASGDPTTAQEFIRRAKEGYYEAMKNFPDSKTRREWQRKFNRDMRAGAAHWTRWAHQWRWDCEEQRTPVYPSMGFALPFLSLANGLAFILFFSILISMLATGAVFGRPLPANLPVWGAVVILCLVYGILVGPLKRARHACYRGCGPLGWSSFAFAMDAVIRLAVVVVLVCLAISYFPELRTAVQSLPPFLHHAADDIQKWWNQK